MAELNIEALKMVPSIDPSFVPAVKWNAAFRQLAAKTQDSTKFVIALERKDSTVSVFETVSLPHTDDYKELNVKYVERLLKFLLWQKGGYKVYLAGNDALAADIKAIYSETGSRAFDYEFMGEKVYGSAMEFIIGDYAVVPEQKELAIPLGRNLDGNRIGFDLGGSDRKAAALVDGKVVYSEEIEWDPYFETDPQYHLDGIRDTLKKAAAHLPGGKIDAIGGSAAGVYVNNEVRVASLFRGVAHDDFEKVVRKIFFDLKDEFGGIPFEVVNDGEVTALAGSMSMNDNAVLGVSMGTSEAAGYVTPEGNINPWLNELAFAPVDYRENGPVDEWSGDIGCGVQFFSQQGIARLIPLAGLDEVIDTTLPNPEKLIEVQKLMAAGDDRARKLYETVGVCFGYAVAHYAEFYDIKNLLILGRVTSGEGGEIIIQKAEEVLAAEYPALAEAITMCTPDEKNKRHGQAVAAGSLPKIG